MKTKHHSILPSAKSCRRKFPTHRTWFGAAFGSFVGIVLLTLSPHVVRAGCTNWDVTGTWEIKQSNGASIILVVVKRGNGFDVTSPSGTHGSGSGNVSGNDFFMEIGWFGGTDSGVYSGKIRSSGRIEGTAYNAGNHPEVKVTWFSADLMKCADAAPVATPKPIKSSGKAKPAPTSLPVVPGSTTGTGGGFIPLHTPTPAPTASAEANQSSSSDTGDQHKKKKNKNKKKHHHHDDDENQDNN